MTGEKDKQRNLTDIMAQLRTTCVQDLESMIMTMEKGGAAGQVFEELFRKVHSVKGSGGTYGLPVITTIQNPCSKPPAV